MDKLKHLLSQHQLVLHDIQGINFVTSPQEKGMTFLKDALYEIVNEQTLLLLSGGRTPKEFYEVLAREERIIPGAVGQVDERYGQPFHEKSNQLMMQEAGLLRYLQMRDIPFYPILKRHSGEEERRLQNHKKNSSDDGSWTSQDDNARGIAANYDATLRDLINRYPKSLGILGIGLDGHTAGVPADPEVWKEFDIETRGKTEYVVDYDDHGRFYGERVTMTFLGLSMLDLLIVIVFGNDKMASLQKMLQDGPENEIPSRFYKGPEIAKKTLILTDQRI